MKSFRKVLGLFVLAVVLAVAGASAFAPKAPAAFFVEHDGRTGAVIEHDRN
jgi:hypothetical protein